MFAATCETIAALLLCVIAYLGREQSFNVISYGEGFVPEVVNDSWTPLNVNICKWYILFFFFPA